MGFLLGFAIAFVLAVCPAAFGSDPDAPTPAANIGGQGGVGGEINLIQSDGTVLRRVTGLGEPIWISGTPTGSYLVVDRSLNRVVDVDLEGRVGWTWTSPDKKTKIVSANAVSNGNILIALGRYGVIELDPEGTTVWRSPPLDLFVTAGVRLEDGSTLLTVSHIEHSAFLVGADGSTTVELDPPQDQGHGFWTRCAPVSPEGVEQLIWDPNWTESFIVTVSENRFEVVDSAPIDRAVTLAGSPSRGFITASDFDLEIVHWHESTAARAITTAYLPGGLAFGPEIGQWVIAFERLGNASWPESRPPPNPEPLVSWPGLLWWIAAGLGIGIGLQFMSWSISTSTQEPAPAQHRLPDRRTNPSGVAQIIVLISVAGAIALTHTGVRMIRDDLSSGWMPLMVVGAISAAFVIEGWRRLVLRRPDPFWAATIEAQTGPSWFRPMNLGMAIIIGGCLLLLGCRFLMPPASEQLGLWLFLLTITLSLAALSDHPPWRRFPNIDWRFWFAMTVPVAVALVTMLYRLRDLPAALHFDHVYYATSALDLVEGRFDDPWEFGFVPAPLVGLVAPMIGLFIAGPGEIGFRLGSALFGITGVVAAGLLGRAYRDRRTGFFAAMLLAGSIPFIHFSRTGANGDAATAAVWTIALFALAVRSNHPRWWILAGMASGFSFYLWPGARVGVVACVLGGLLMSFRSPRLLLRRWRGPLALLIACAVWIVPLVPMWVEDAAAIFPRAEESLEVYKPSTGIRADRLAASFGEPTLRSLGWFFALPDSSTHGSITPGCSEFEATLLAVGLVIVLIEGWSLNLVLALCLFLVLLILGAFGGNPPWYTRMIPSMPIAVVLMARALVGGLDLFATTRKPIRQAALLGAVVAVLLLSPMANFASYMRAESTGEKVPILDTMTITGRRLRALGPDYHHYIVITNNTEWSCDGERRNGLFGILLPYIWDLHVSEIRDLDTVLPLPGDEAAAVVLQIDRIETDLATLRGWYPGLEVEILVDRKGQPRAGLVIIEKHTVPVPSAGMEDSTNESN